MDTTRIDNLEPLVRARGSIEHTSAWASRSASWLLTLGGALLFTVQYWGNRALWLDEAWLALAVLERPLVSLLEPLGRDQIAPPGFLVLVKLAAAMLGSSEFALRLVPFISGLGALLLFRWTATQLLERRSALVAVGLFAISPSLVYYSSELKPYISDVAVAIALLGMAMWVERGEKTPRRLGALAVAGVLAVWLSLPAAFVLGGIGLTLGANYALRRAWRPLLTMCAAAACWLASFGVLYLLVLQGESGNPALQSHWRTAFMPIPGVTTGEVSLLGGVSLTVEWLGRTVLQTFEWSGGYVLSGLAAFAAVVGGVALYRSRPLHLALLLAPIALTLIVSALRLYPFADRMVLFLVPILLLLVGAGIGAIWKHTATGFPAIGLLLVAILTLQPLYRAMHFLMDPPMQLRRTDDVRPALRYLKQHVRSGSPLYIHPAAEGPVTYYARRLDFEPGAIRTLDVGVERSGFGFITEDDWSTHEDAIDAFPEGERVWILFYPTWAGQVQKHSEQYRESLDQRGTRKVAWKGEGWVLLAYDMNGAKPLEGDESARARHEAH